MPSLLAFVSRICHHRRQLAHRVVSRCTRTKGHHEPNRYLTCQAPIGGHRCGIRFGGAGPPIGWRGWPGEPKHFQHPDLCICWPDIHPSNLLLWIGSDLSHVSDAIELQRGAKWRRHFPPIRGVHVRKSCRCQPIDGSERFLLSRRSHR